MRSKYAWLLLPPALALIVFIGPLQSLNPSTSGNTATNTNSPDVPERASTTTANRTRSEVGSQLPQLPSMWQVGSTLIGVLLLGVTFVFLIRKVKLSRLAAPGSALTLRQSLRLSAKHHVHAVQYEDQILVLGACDNSISVLLTSADPGIAEDEAEIQRRNDDLDEGAVPRDMILPRPEKARTKAPKKPRTATGTARLARTGTARTKARAKALDQIAAAKVDPQKLADFHALLKATREKANV